MWQPPAGLTLSLLATLAGCQSAETWGFVATLGSDTTSVERVTRQGNQVVGEAVGRSPVVVHRRWTATFAADGSLRRWTMDSHIPNAPPGETDLHHSLDFSGDTVRVVRQAGADSIDRNVIIGYQPTVPWNAFLYSTLEALLQAARDRPDSVRIGQYFFEGWAEGHFGYAELRRLGSGEVSFSSTGLAGSGRARVDEQGRLVSYSGDGTTYKQEVRRITQVPEIGPLVERFAAAERSSGFSRWLSPRDTMRASVGAAAVTVDYSRPLVRGRTLVGGLIPYDEVWRTGANAATQLGVSAPVRLAGVLLPAGTYTLWTLPTHQGVDLIINRQTGQWGTEYRSSQDVARRPMSVAVPPASVERFTIRVDSASARLVMEWGTFRWSAPIEDTH